MSDMTFLLFFSGESCNKSNHENMMFKHLGDQVRKKLLKSMEILQKIQDFHGFSWFFPTFSQLFPPQNRPKVLSHDSREDRRLGELGIFHHLALRLKCWQVGDHPLLGITYTIYTIYICTIIYVYTIYTIYTIYIYVLLFMCVLICL